jgi:DNA-binding response OmpR family regulator
MRQVAAGAERIRTVAETLVVVADSNADLLELVTRELSERGYEVATAMDGQQALEMIRARRPAAAVLDWVMPVLQGPKVCSLLKADPVTAGIPVVLLTARVSEQDIAAGFEEGADEYLTKPFAVDELDETLRRLIGKEA